MRPARLKASGKRAASATFSKVNEWDATPRLHPDEPADIEDRTRFNEAIDPSLAASVAEFIDTVESAKELFLAIVGHDLRTPLGAIYTSARFMLDTDELEEPYRTLTSRIASSATRTVDIVGDLLDFTRSRLGGGIPVTRVKMSLGKVVHDVIEEITSAHPEQEVQFTTRGEQSRERHYLHDPPAPPRIATRKSPAAADERLFHYGQGHRGAGSDADSWACGGGTAFGTARMRLTQLAVSKEWAAFAERHGLARNRRRRMLRLRQEGRSGRAA